jgi:hypothetical protein
MIENLPLYVVITFIFTALLTVGIFQRFCKQSDFSSKTNKFLSFILPFGLLFQAILAVGGFYKFTDTFPPRLFLFGVSPAIPIIIGLFIFSKDFISKLPLQNLTIIHIVRIPVEIVLYWLFVNEQIPQIMTFEGRNFDILIGLTAPIVFWLAFRYNSINRLLLIIWNLLGLALLANIVTHAALSIPSNFQKFGLDQPNIAVLHFPFIWLPTIIVPIVLFCHLASLWKILKENSK